MNLPQLPNELKDKKINVGNIREFVNAWAETNDWEKYKGIKIRRIEQPEELYLIDHGYSNYTDPKDLIEFLKDCDEYDFDVFDQYDDDYEIRFRKYKVEQVHETKEDVINNIWREWSTEWNKWMNEQALDEIKKKEDTLDYQLYLKLKKKFEEK